MPGYVVKKLFLNSFMGCTLEYLAVVLSTYTCSGHVGKKKIKHKVVPVISFSIDGNW